MLEPNGEVGTGIEQEWCGLHMSAANDRPLGEVRFLTVAEVAAVMRVSKMTVYRLVKAGELPAIRVGKHLRIRTADLAAYLDARVVTAADDDEEGPWPAA